MYHHISLWAVNQHFSSFISIPHSVVKTQQESRSEHTKMQKICWSQGLRPGPRWGSLQRSPRPPSWWGGGSLPPPQELHPRSRPSASNFSPSGFTTPPLKTPWLRHCSQLETDVAECGRRWTPWTVVATDHSCLCVMMMMMRETTGWGKLSRTTQKVQIISASSQDSERTVTGNRSTMVITGFGKLALADIQAKTPRTVTKINIRAIFAILQSQAPDQPPGS